MTNQEKRQLIIKTAEKYIGEQENPPNSNNIFFNTRFYGREVWDGDKPKATYPWCFTSASEIFIEAGFPLGNIGYLRGGASCYTGIERLTDKDPKKRWGVEVTFEEALPADLVFYDWQGDGKWDHVGILKTKNLQTAQMSVLEGNTSTPMSSDPKEAAKANSNGGEFMLKDDRKYIKGRVKIVRPNCLIST